MLERKHSHKAFNETYVLDILLLKHNKLLLLPTGVYRIKKRYFNNLKMLNNDLEMY